MITALRRVFSPDFRLREDFRVRATSLPDIKPCQRYLCVDIHGAFNHDPRTIQLSAFGYGAREDQVTTEISRHLQGVVTVEQEVMEFDLRKVRGSTCSKHSAVDRTLSQWGAKLLHTNHAAVHLSTPQQQLDYCLHEGIRGANNSYSRASWMQFGLYCESTSQADLLAQAIALADLHGIERNLTGQVTTYTAHARAASRLCEEFGAWVCDPSTADAIKGILSEHQVSVYWSFIGRQHPFLGYQTVLYLPRNQPLAGTAHNLMADLLWAHKVETMFTWLNHFTSL